MAISLVDTDYEERKDVINYSRGIIKKLRISLYESPLDKEVDKNKSYSTHDIDSWSDLKQLFDPEVKELLNELEKNNIVLPEFVDTVIKKSDIGNEILMCWPSKDAVIFSQDVSEETIAYCEDRGWHIYRQDEIDVADLKKVVN